MQRSCAHNFFRILHSGIFERWIDPATTIWTYVVSSCYLTDNLPVSNVHFHGTSHQNFILLPSSLNQIPDRSRCCTLEVIWHSSVTPRRCWTCCTRIQLSCHLATSFFPRCCAMTARRLNSATTCFQRTQILHLSMPKV
ncbi:hypothetical protein BD410DRAFT_608841 [Rickenella mellea]|uniref:Uncharacterized protein n=1 Tax=Rickenella mellea TaxID=50990 RepID=A0A4Y7QFE6_9AGAM|nr:hypothetical protein BD410DRAFT_608841 [Rickenella mellea]